MQIPFWRTYRRHDAGQVPPYGPRCDQGPVHCFCSNIYVYTELMASCGGKDHLS